MKKVRIPISVIISTYAVVLLLLAAGFLMRDQGIHRLQSTVPVYFLLRFCTFWFISFILAVIFYLANLNLNYLGTTETEKKYSLQVGFLALGAGTLLLLLALLLIMYLNL
ncbi:hypothetical protein [Pontibacter beigongshangensis]|uniref:hypothetical protein n=1 Tax=Pontibacter beigongshangensis TaxID=2574733 RepID=UPI0016501802|nr:hypothetical protein [Pontibacter beigongshangensis]